MLTSAKKQENHNSTRKALAYPAFSYKAALLHIDSSGCISRRYKSFGVTAKIIYLCTTKRTWNEILREKAPGILLT
jgi:hypothetical protein